MRKCICDIAHIFPYIYPPTKYNLLFTYRKIMFCNENYHAFPAKAPPRRRAKDKAVDKAQNKFDFRPLSFTTQDTG